MSDWDASDDEKTKNTTTPAVIAVKPPGKANKWDGEDEEEDGPVVSLLLGSPSLHVLHYQMLTFGPVGFVRTLERLGELRIRTRENTGSSFQCRTPEEKGYIEGEAGREGSRPRCQVCGRRRTIRRGCRTGSERESSQR